MQHIALHFYLGLKNEPWFGPPGSKNAWVCRNSGLFAALVVHRCLLYIFPLYLSMPRSDWLFSLLKSLNVESLEN